MRFFRVFIAGLALAGLLLAEEIVPSFSPGHTITYTPPDRKVWKVDSREEEAATGLVMYKRNEITDKNGSIVAPTLSIIYQKLPEDVDLKEFVAYSRERLPYPVEKELEAPNGAALLIMRYSERGFEHIFVVGHLVLSGLGVRIFFDTTLSVYKDVEADWFFFLASVSLKKK